MYPNNSNKKYDWDRSRCARFNLWPHSSSFLLSFKNIFGKAYLWNILRVSLLWKTIFLFLKNIWIYMLGFLTKQLTHFTKLILCIFQYFLIWFWSSLEIAVSEHPSKFQFLQLFIVLYPNFLMYFASKVCTFSSGLKNAIKQKKISVLVKSHSKESFALLKTVGQLKHQQNTLCRA